jgi:hypothetical protein
LAGLLLHQNQARNFVSPIKLQPQALDLGARQGFVEDDGEGIAAKTAAFPLLSINRARAGRQGVSAFLLVSSTNTRFCWFVMVTKLLRPLRG